jgi:hypothetical protein
MYGSKRIRIANPELHLVMPFIRDLKRDAVAGLIVNCVRLQICCGTRGDAALEDAQKSIGSVNRKIILGLTVFR